MRTEVQPSHRHYIDSENSLDTLHSILIRKANLDPGTRRHITCGKLVLLCR